MDVMEPELVWIEGRCYRAFEHGTWSNRQIVPYSEDNYLSDPDDISDEEDIEIVPHYGTRNKHSFHVAKSFYPHIIGAKHAVRKKLESETKTMIQIPRLGQDGPITIIGSDRKGIIKAKRRINMIVQLSKSKIPITHFLSIPMNSECVIAKFKEFKNNILKNSESVSRGISESIFQMPNRLHLTIEGLLLLDDQEREQALEAFTYSKSTIVDPILEEYGPIFIELYGVDCMNDDPSEVHVLYAKVKENEALQVLADKLAHFFADKGLVNKKRSGKVKLHVTLMNTKFNLKEDENMSKRTTFDAREILKAHENTSFGEVIMKEIHLSIRGSENSKEKYYPAAAILNLLD